MRVRSQFAVVAVIAAVLTGVAAPAQAAPKLPPGCAFDADLGQTSCVTVVTTTETVGPITHSGPTGTFFGFSAAEICRSWFGEPGDPGYYWFTGVMLDTLTVQTTTTVRQGTSGKGKVVSSETETSVSLIAVSGGDVNCDYGYN